MIYIYLGHSYRTDFADCEVYKGITIFYLHIKNDVFTPFIYTYFIKLYGQNIPCPHYLNAVYGLALEEIESKTCCDTVLKILSNNVCTVPSLPKITATTAATPASTIAYSTAVTPRSSLK